MSTTPVIKTTSKAELAKRTLADVRWRSIAERDASADGRFFYSVGTTGVYCRPSCGARLARPENVQFYTTYADAERAGFRPCKRCKPSEQPAAEQRAAKIAESCRLIEESEELPGLAALAAEAGLSPFHFHRTFKAVTGLTPKQYAAAHRAKRMRLTLEKGASVTDAIYAAGFQSNSRFYEQANDVLGMTPSNFRARGANTDIHFAVGECSLGAILAAQSERGVCAILIGDDPDQLLRELQHQFRNANLIGADSGYEGLVAKVVGLLDRPEAGLNLPLDIRGTVFQQRVWNALMQIPVGTTATYAEIAERIGKPKAYRAVARACGANVLAVAIPCHRVIRNDGGVSGYRWGVERKRTLLEREAAQ